MAFRTQDYPPDWPAVRAAILERAGHRCEWCQAVNRESHPTTGRRVVLTIAHLNGRGGPCACRPLCGEPAHLAALCQRCHLSYDRPKHVRAARERRRARRATGDLFQDRG